MPVARFEMPDGRIARFEVPEGTTPEQAQAQIEAMIAGGEISGQSAPAQKPAPAGGNPQPSPDNGRSESPLPDWLQQADRWAQDNVPGMDALGELAASANRSVTELVDFLGPDSVNAVLELAGSENRVPTLTGALENTGIEGGFMEPGAARDVVQAGGALIPAAAGIAPVQRAAGTVGNSILDLLGAGSSSVATPVREGAQYAAGATREALPSLPQSASTKAKALPLKRQTGDLSTYGYKLDETGNRVVKDKAQRGAGKQGFEKGFVAMVNAAPEAAKGKFRRMVNIVDEGRNNFRKQATERPLDVAGESIVNRFDVVKAANRVAGSRLDDVAKSLKGEPVDVQPAVDSLLGKLDDMGISFDPAEGKMSFSGSDIEGLAGPQRIIKNMLSRMRNTQAPDAYDIHRMKKFIDENVTYGKSQRGLSGKSERIFKELRHDLDGILDSNFPAYDKVNSQYAETRRVLDGLQDVAGKKMDLTGPNADKAVGTLARRLLSNAQSRIPLMDAVDDLDRVAKKYLTQGNDVVPYKAVSRATGKGKPALTMDDLDDDVIGQVMFVDELEKLFGSSARTSLQGDVGKAIDRGIEGGTRGVVVEGARSGLNKIRGINEDNAMKAIKELVR